MRKGILIGIAATLLICTGAAASSYLITSINQIKPSVRRALKGDRGARGYRGFAGADGATGAAGVFTSSNVTTVVGPTDTMPPDAVGSSLAVCPSGDTPIAGGWEEDDPAIVSSVTESQPLSTSWGVIVVNNDPNESASVAAIAQCASGSSAELAHEASRAETATTFARQVSATRLKLQRSQQRRKAPHRER